MALQVQESDIIPVAEATAPRKPPMQEPPPTNRVKFRWHCWVIGVFRRSWWDEQPGRWAYLVTTVVYTKISSFAVWSCLYGLLCQSMVSTKIFTSHVTIYKCMIGTLVRDIYCMRRKIRTTLYTIYSWGFSSSLSTCSLCILTTN